MCHEQLTWKSKKNMMELKRFSTDLHLKLGPGGHNCLLDLVLVTLNDLNKHEIVIIPLRVVKKKKYSCFFRTQLTLF